MPIDTVINSEAIKNNTIDRIGGINPTSELFVFCLYSIIQQPSLDKYQ
ncbi:hypothetical protein [Shewanella sp. OMA3-2]|nr:hypothetical protein [Shewanella sp. OMA3-2]UJF22317.1 hypothetical protein L0B17_02455 [Shewanella sp. OMA3-2]